MNRVTAAIAIALLAIGTAIVPNGANAAVPGEGVTPAQAPSHMSAAAKNARVERASGKTFMLNGHRILVPADASADSVIKALKARFPNLKPDAGAQNDFSVAD